MSAGAFSGVDFAVGSVRGFRGWKVSVEGTLLPFSLGAHVPWVPGENVAVCHGTPTKDQVAPRSEGEEWSDYRARVDAWRADHQFEECNHGFYAFFDPSARAYESGPVVRGVIEGYGEVLIGTKGFRAMKARILAVSIEPHQGMWALEQFVVDRIRRNYPGVALFESAMAMQVEFPAVSLEGVAS